MELNIVVWLMGAIIVVGIVEWAKAVVTAVAFPVKWSSVIYAVLIPVASFVASVANGTGIWVALGIWAVAQIGYELIIRTVRKKLGGE